MQQSPTCLSLFSRFSPLAQKRDIELERFLLWMQEHQYYSSQQPLQTQIHTDKSVALRSVGCMTITHHGQSITGCNMISVMLGYYLLLYRPTLCSSLQACQRTRHNQNRQAPRAHGHKQMGSVRHLSPWQQQSCWRSTCFVSGPITGSWLLNETLYLILKNTTNNKT